MRDLRGLFIGSFATALMACSPGDPAGSIKATDSAITDGAHSDNVARTSPDATASGEDTVDPGKNASPQPDAVIRDDAMSADAISKDSATSTRDSAPTTTPDVGYRDGTKATPDAARSDTLPSDTGSRPNSDGSMAPPSCASESLRTTGTIHYVCDCQSGASGKCVAGNDSNAGTTPGAPLRSFAKAADTFAKMPAGDTVALCRGGRWNVTGSGGFANASCKKDNTCDLRDYAPSWGDGSESVPSLWTNGGSSGTTVISFTHVAQHQEGFRVFNLDLHGTNADTGIFFWNETTDVDLCNLSMDGFSGSINMSGGDKPELGIPARIVLRRSRITNNSDIAYIAVCDHCAIEDSYFDNNGVRNSTTHSVYFASTVWTVDGKSVIHETDGMRLSRNEFHHSTVECKGAPVVVHGRHKNVLLENNVMDAVKASDGCWGLGVGCGGYPYGCWFRNAVIRGNTIRGLGNTGTENNNCTDCLIENNLVILDRSGNGITVGGEKPRAAGDSGYTRSDGQLDEAVSNAVIRNNTIQFTETATSGKGIWVASGSGHTVENNAIHFTTSKAGTSDNLCYGLPGSTTSTLKSVDYNVCEVPAGAHWTTTPDSGAMALDAWQRLSAFDKHSKMLDPGMANPPSDCTPTVASPLVNAGDPANSPTIDMNGKLRDTQPDIGAIEL